MKRRDGWQPPHELAKVVWFRPEEMATRALGLGRFPAALLCTVVPRPWHDGRFEQGAISGLVCASKVPHEGRKAKAVAHANNVLLLVVSAAELEAFAAAELGDAQRLVDGLQRTPNSVHVAVPRMAGVRIVYLKEYLATVHADD